MRLRLLYVRFVESDLFFMETASYFRYIPHKSEILYKVPLYIYVNFSLHLLQDLWLTNELPCYIIILQILGQVAICGKKVFHLMKDLLCHILSFSDYNQIYDESCSHNIADRKKTIAPSLKKQFLARFDEFKHSKYGIDEMCYGAATLFQCGWKTKELGIPVLHASNCDKSVRKCDNFAFSVNGSHFLSTSNMY